VCVFVVSVCCVCWFVVCVCASCVCMSCRVCVSFVVCVCRVYVGVLCMCVLRSSLRLAETTPSGSGLTRVCVSYVCVCRVCVLCVCRLVVRVCVELRTCGCISMLRY